LIIFSTKSELMEMLVFLMRYRIPIIFR